MGKAGVLEALEWGLLLRIIINHLRFFVSKENERVLLLHLLMRTLPFYKFEERYAPRYLIYGRGSLCTLSQGLDTANLKKARQGLEASGLVTFEKPHGAVHGSPWTCRINAPGIVAALRGLFDQMVSHDSTAKELASQLSQIQTKLEAEWSRRGWSARSAQMVEKTKVGIEERIREAREQSIEIKKKRRARMEAAERKEFRPGWIFELMKSYCEEAGIDYHDPVQTQKEKKVIGGNVRNFVNVDCPQLEITPAKLLYLVCDQWRFFRGDLKREYGTSILLPASVSFLNFYRYRRQITEWLHVHRGAEKTGVKVIDNTEAFNRFVEQMEREAE